MGWVCAARDAKMAPPDRRAVCAALLLCSVVSHVCPRVGGQQRFDTVPGPNQPRPPNGDDAATDNRSPLASTNRFGDSRGDSATNSHVGPNYDPENKRYGGSNRNPYHSRSGGYRNRFSTNNFGLPQEDRQVDGVGILAGWRDDLQGQKRPEAAFMNPYIEVQTRLGPVTGFIVQMYDKPKLPEELWPANLQLELQKHQLNVSTFLGIPYAQAPVDEGRFKVSQR